MKRVVIAAFVGGLVYYIWQMLAFPLHGPTVHPLPDEDPVRDALVAQQLDTGLYVAPYGTNDEMAHRSPTFQTPRVRTDRQRLLSAAAVRPETAVHHGHWFCHRLRRDRASGGCS